MAKKVRIGFVGGGFMGQLAHISNYAKLEDVELVALAEGRPELAKKVADRYGIGEVYSNHKELLANAEIDAVVAIMHFNLHHAVVPDILNAGKHLITEKPICVDPKKGAEMVKLAEEKSVIYYVGYMKRSDAGTRYVKSQIDEWKDSGDVGDMRYIRCHAAMADWTWGIEPPISSGESYPEYENETVEPPPDWMTKEEGNQYVGFINFWIHQVNLLRHLAGEDYKLTHVSENGLLLIGETESGASINLEMNTRTIKSSWEEEFSVYFPKAEASLSLAAPLHKQMEGKVRIVTEGETGPVSSEPFVGTGWGFADQARMFVEAVRGDRPVLSPASHAVKDLKIAEDYIRMLRDFSEK